MPKIPIIYAFVDKENTASVRLLDKLGFSTKEPPLEAQSSTKIYQYVPGTNRRHKSRSSRQYKPQQASDQALRSYPISGYFDPFYFHCQYLCLQRLGICVP